MRRELLARVVLNSTDLKGKRGLVLTSLLYFLSKHRSSVFNLLDRFNARMAKMIWRNGSTPGDATYKPICPQIFLRERKKGPQAWDPPDVIATMTISTKSKLKGYKIQGINDALFP